MRLCLRLHTKPHCDLAARRRCRGVTLVETAVASLIIMISALGLLYMLALQRSNTVNAGHAVEALALVQGRIDSLLADLSESGDSPLAAVLPRDFTRRFAVATGNPSAPWSVSVSESTQPVTLGPVSAFRLKTTVQYLDDSADNVSPTDADPYDALKLTVSIVPGTAGAPNPYEYVALQTLWYH